MTELQLLHETVQTLVRFALAEDIGSGDITTSLLIPPDLHGAARVIAKEPLITAGYLPFQKVFEAISHDIVCSFLISEGAWANTGDVIAELSGPYGALLTGERTALNFLQHLSGIATLTRTYIERLKPYRTVLLDTRKTIPGWRILAKEAVRLGGGTNHRMGLYDAILIKENHIAACGSIKKAVEKARRCCKNLKIEVEVRTRDELLEALQCCPDMIMLDNMNLDDIRYAVAESGGRIPLEASGNVTLDNIHKIAATGVQYISVGALTHSSRSADISMLIEPMRRVTS
ncbi:MAG: carboxylating nicotinate-nucleotide diphosphorylase [Desulfobacterota bacterium]|nr:carboxylating nicotinate-nucleotide diphosphorylase [Thermodesulfobacteriota bacterium]